MKAWAGPYISSETKVSERRVAGHVVTVWRNDWSDGAVGYSVVNEDKDPVGDEDFDHVPTDEEITALLPGFVCNVCDEKVGDVDTSGLRAHLEGHRAQVDHFNAEEVHESFTWEE